MGQGGGAGAWGGGQEGSCAEAGLGLGTELGDRPGRRLSGGHQAGGLEPEGEEGDLTFLGQGMGRCWLKGLNCLKCSIPPARTLRWFPISLAICTLCLITPSRSHLLLLPQSSRLAYLDPTPLLFGLPPSPGPGL